MSASSLSRRTFLQLGARVSAIPLLASSGLVGLTACKKPGADTPQSFYDMLRAIQTGLQVSPDHPRAKAKTLAATGDIDAITQFVRDEIRLVSHSDWRFSLGSKRRFGERAALRAGAGTAYEKAAILQDLLTQAGHEARIVMSPKMSREQVHTLFFRDYEQAFDPDLAEADLRNWQQKIPGAAADVAVTDVAEAHDIPALRKKIKTALGDQLSKVQNGRYDTRQDGLIPIVEIKQADGSLIYADPIRPGSVVGPLEEGLRLSEPRESDGTFPVKVTLSATTSANPEKLIPLVSKEWRSDQIAGRQMNIGFKPIQDLTEIVVSRIGDLRMFTPILSLQDVYGLDDLEPEEMGAVGDAITVEGDHIALDPETGEVRVNSIAVATPEPSGLANKVTAIDVTPNAATFPDMHLDVTPRDADGNVVSGLSAADFQVADEGDGVMALLKSTDPALRVLFLADASLSMPSPYRLLWEDDGAAMKALAARVEEIATRLHPNAQVELQPTNSNLWEELDKHVAERAPNLVVCATDGDLAGKSPDGDPDLAARLRGGPPVIVLSCEDPIEEIRAKAASRNGSNLFDDMADLTGGLVLDAVTDDIAPLETAIANYLANVHQAPAYTLSYRALTQGTETRQVRVQLGSANQTAPYEIDSDLTGRGTKLASLRLTVEMNKISVEQVLAGHDGRSGPPTPEDFDHVHGALLGKHMLLFEGAAPSLSVILDEVVTARLDLEALDTAIADNVDDAALLETLEQGFATLDGRLAALMGRPMALSGKDFAFAEQGLRTVLHSQHPVMNSSELVDRMDILPTARPGILSPDQAVRQDKAFENSLRLAGAEASLFGTSTISLLADQELSVFERRTHRSLDLDDAEKEAWEGLMEKSLRRNYSRHPGSIFLSDTAGKTRAVWAVDRGTGEIIGVLPDGTGGGFGPPSQDESQRAAEDIKRQLKELDQVLSGLNLLISFVPLANPLGGASLGLVAAYGQQLARLYAAASLALILTDGRVAQDALRTAIAGMACEIAKTIALTIFSGAGKVASKVASDFGRAEAILGVAGAPSPFSCPSRSPPDFN